MLATGWMRGVRRAMPRARSMSSFEYKAGNDIVIRNALVWANDVTEYSLHHLTICGRSGKIKEIQPGCEHVDEPKEGGPYVIDAGGGLVTPTFAEPHLHLDAVFLGKAWPNKSGTLVEGIANWDMAKVNLTANDVIARASTAVKWMVACGTTRIRTHADTGCPVGVEALIELKQSLSKQSLADIQIVGFPQDGILTSDKNRNDFDWAVQAGIDAVGGIPHIERTYNEGTESLKIVFDTAEKIGLKVDVHCDETDDPHSKHIETVCAHTMDRSMGGHVVAGHCTAMHSYNGPAANKIITSIVRSGVQIITNPLDSVVLQGRFDDYPKRRGLTRVPELLNAGGVVGVGHDSVCDPWYPLGVGNIMDAAYMVVHLCHLSGQEEMRRVFEMLVSDNHMPFGGQPRIQVGETALLLVHSLSDPVDILRMRRLPLFVIHNGRIVATNSQPVSTVLSQEFDLGVIPQTF
ncbi:hypothetical protein AAMO2058_000249200 [Amorphochlora amoebiformis]